MVKYMIKRLIFSVVVLLLLMTFLYYVFWYVNISEWTTSPIELADYTGFITEKLLDYIGNLFQGDFGTYLGDDVKEMVLHRAHYTLKICFASLVFFVVFGVFLGVISALFRNRWIDKLINGFSTIFSSIPSFVLVWFLMLFLGWRLQIVPAIYPAGTENPIEALLGLVIPVLSLSLWPLSKITQLVRNEIVDGLDSDANLLTKAKGMTEKQTIMRHHLKNAMVVALPEVPISFVFVLASSFIVEIIYNVNGMANLFMDSILMPYFFGVYGVYFHIPVTMIITFFYIGLGILVSLVIDLVQVVLDPRIKLTSKKTYQ